MKNISVSEALELILGTKDSGRLFSARFIKKDGTPRNMVCRLGVTKDLKGVGLKFDALSKGLIPVYDTHKRAYRMINLNSLKALQINKQFYTVGA